MFLTLMRRALVLSLVLCFFFQAEDGIRDYKVTGVQTCALPICGLVDLHLGALHAGALEAGLLHLDRITTGNEGGEEEGPLFGRGLRKAADGTGDRDLGSRNCGFGSVINYAAQIAARGPLVLRLDGYREDHDKCQNRADHEPFAFHSARLPSLPLPLSKPSFWRADGTEI